MRLLFDNVSFDSSSGPNSFGRQLALSLSARGHVICEAHESPDVQLTFIQPLIPFRDDLPVVQRLDGIWFNVEQDYRSQNEPLIAAYRRANAVVVQSEFDRMLIEHTFGMHERMHVIHNGTDIDVIASASPLHVPSLQGVERVWTCASSWRPHKRLVENVRYFREHSGPNDVLVIAGQNPDVSVADPRIFYAGQLDREHLVALYRATDVFIHLAWLDHCPNVVVDARAAGCHIVCSSSGGTHEIAGENSTVIVEDEWDFEPCALYRPPPLDFSKRRGGRQGASIDIADVSASYENVLRSVV